MSISRIQAIETDNNVPKVDIDSTVNNVPKFPVDLQGGASPIDLQSISISENGTTEAPEGVAYNEINVNVPQTTLTTISITENGTTTAPSGTAYNEIVVNVPTNIMYNWNFKGKSGTTISDDKVSLVGNLSGATSITSDGVATDGFTRFDPLLLNTQLLLPNYKVRFKIKFGEFFSTSHSSGEKGRIFSFGTDMALYWNDVPMLYGSGVGGSYRLTTLDNQFDLLENNELIVDFYKENNTYKVNWIFPNNTIINYGTVSDNLSVIIGEYQYTDNGLGGVYIENFEISLVPNE